MFKFFGIYKIITLILLVVSFSCTKKQVRDLNQNNKVAKKKLNSQKAKSLSYRRGETGLDDLNRVKIDYSNESTDLGATFDLDRDDLNIVLKGNRKNSRLNFSKSKKTKPKESFFTKKKNFGKVLTGIRKAQQLFYAKQYEKALKVVKNAIKEKETAEGYALLGSIYYVLGEEKNASKNWKKSLNINPDLPEVVDMLEYLKTKVDK